MRHYRLSIDVDIKAKDKRYARHMAERIYAEIEQISPCIVEVLPNGMEERIPLK